jgi:hypothetical protein
MEKSCLKANGGQIVFDIKFTLEVMACGNLKVKNTNLT